MIDLKNHPALTSEMQPRARFQTPRTELITPNEKSFQPVECAGTERIRHAQRGKRLQAMMCFSEQGSQEFRLFVNRKRRGRSQKKPASVHIVVRNAQTSREAINMIRNLLAELPDLMAEIAGME